MQRKLLPVSLQVQHQNQSMSSSSESWGRGIMPRPSVQSRTPRMQVKYSAPVFCFDKLPQKHTTVPVLLPEALPKRVHTLTKKIPFAVVSSHTITIQKAGPKFISTGIRSREPPCWLPLLISSNLDYWTGSGSRQLVVHVAILRVHLSFKFDTTMKRMLE